MQDLRNLDKEPFVIQNRVYVLGNPVVNAQTLEQLVYALDQLGDKQPIVIINPEAQAIPNFDTMLSNLIQNNRSRQAVNVTSTDKYKFKDLTDNQLEELVKQTVGNNPSIDYNRMLEIYQGLRIRAQSLYYLDNLSKERDAIWSHHCANPSSNEGVERYSELQYKLIPEAQSYYDFVCNRLKELDEGIINTEDNTEQHAATLATQQKEIQHITQQPEKQVAANEAINAANVNNTQVQQIHSTIEEKNEVSIWKPWLSEEYLKMPLSQAKQVVAAPAYSSLVRQQSDIVIDGVSYKAVEPEYLIALGIPLVNDGVPIVYTSLGKFKRIGDSNVVPNNLSYWYPEPRRL